MQKDVLKLQVLSVPEEENEPMMISTFSVGHCHKVSTLSVYHCG